jgi:signal transduction histidine kinase
LANPVNVLIVEDNEDDAALLFDTLRRGGLEATYRRVENAESLASALKELAWDVVLPDCVLPQFCGADAIRIVREICGSVVPVIIVSGIIEEETAVELIKLGAQDFVSKGKLARLPGAVEREIKASVTRRKKAQADNQLALERESFISILAHDLRAPVQRIEAMAKLLRAEHESTLNPDAADIVSRIQTSAARLRTMLASLFSYSCCSRGAIAGRVASLSSTIDKIIEDAENDKVSAEFRINLGGIEWCKGEAVLLEHVLQNLIGNAMKFRHADVPLRIDIAAVRLDDDMIQVSVADNGIGIEPRFAEKVFEIFYRLHDDDEYTGTGVGLAICKRIVNDHGGEIWIDKKFCGGTRIHFTLQAVDTPSPIVRDVKAATAATRLSLH